MLNFEPCTVECLKRLAPRFRGLPTLCCELSAGTIWMWRAEQEPQICLRNDTLVLRQIMNGYPAFTYPVGPDVDGMLDALIEQAREEDIALRFFAMDEGELRRLLEDRRFGDTLWGYDRRWSDYIYPFEPYTTLSGGSLHKIRYKVNHFTHLYGPRTCVRCCGSICPRRGRCWRATPRSTRTWESWRRWSCATPGSC